jgi:endonuclease/exonuclease/phosphatase family metal-dependent hydrolase
VCPPSPHKADARRLRIATFNLLHGESLSSGRVDEAELRNSVRQIDPDILAIQEVDRLQPRSGLVDQTELIAETLRAPYWRFVPALNGVPSGAWTRSFDDDGALVAAPTFGVGLVSRVPVREWHVRRLPATPVSMPVMVAGSRGREWVPEPPRVALAGVLDGPFGPLTVVSLHLSIIPGWNVAQLRAVAVWAKALPGPRLLLGDFNLPGPVVQRVSGCERLAQVKTFPAGRPRVQLDHVLGDGIRPEAVQDVLAAQLPVSDHRALLVTLQL